MIYCDCTIVIPTFARGDLLLSTVKQIVGQSILPSKVIISDNDSISFSILSQINLLFDSKKIVLDYYKQARNLGVIGNILFLLDLVDTEFFTIFSDDDWHSPHFLEHSFNHFSSNIDYVFTDFSEVDSNGLSVPPYPTSHYWLLRYLVTAPNWLKPLLFIVIPSELGKQNLFYSVFRSSSILPIIKPIKKLSLNPNDLLHYDLLLSYLCLISLRGVVIDSILFTLTVRNTKFYLNSNVSLPYRIFGRIYRPLLIAIDFFRLFNSQFYLFTLFISLPIKFFLYLFFYPFWRMNLFFFFSSRTCILY